MSLAEVAQTGDRLKTLHALRDYLAKALDETDSARDKASLSARFADVLAQIAELDPPKKETNEFDDLIASLGVG